MEELSQGRVPNPCTPDCPKRTSFCHGECPEYAKYHAYRRLIYKARIKDFDANALQSDSISKGKRRYNFE